MTDSYVRQIANAIRATVQDDADGDDLLYLVYAVLALAKGEQVTPSDIHDAWAAVAEHRGAAGPDLVPFSELPAHVRGRDEPYAAAVRAVAGNLRVSAAG